MRFMKNSKAKRSEQVSCKESIIVIGGGAAGLMAAGIAASNGYNVSVLEKNSILGKKLRITGKGRCNVTNNCEIQELMDNIPVNPRFLYSAFSAFNAQDTISFFESLGVPLKTERGNRVFPVSDNAQDIVDCLIDFVKKNHVHIINGTAKSLIAESGQIRGIGLQDGSIIFCDKVIIATGGVSYPGTGSTGDGYKLARQAGHSIIDPKPSLVPLVEGGNYCKRMQGLSLKNIKLYIKNSSGKVIFEDFGELLFTHFGLSGPVILSASAHMRDFKNKSYYAIIDLKSALNEEKLDCRLLRDFEKNSNKDFSNALYDLLPKKMIDVFIERCAIPLDKKVNNITREERSRILKMLKHFSIEISEARPIEEAIITSGGVCTKEINPKTMESKLVSGLYFAGEVIDVDAYTGGFNLQIAFSTGYLAGQIL